MSSWKFSNIDKEIITSLIESPLYFTMPLEQRLALVKQAQEGYSYSNLRNIFLNWVKTGYFK